ncbi:hypothetical protein Z949_1947 [Sulfitobacter guttiformis KCTC 32187]|nr:hypothetical protein Z949_1947 [Sulfitobacter guttiformis KCTC 32187]
MADFPVNRVTNSIVRFSDDNEPTSPYRWGMKPKIPALCIKRTKRV